MFTGYAPLSIRLIELFERPQGWGVFEEVCVCVCVCGCMSYNPSVSAPGDSCLAWAPCVLQESACLEGTGEEKLVTRKP